MKLLQKNFRPVLVTLLLLVIAVQNQGLANSLSNFDKLNNAGYVLADRNGQVLEEVRKDKPLIPASTTKLVTAWLALKHWGEEYRFATRLHWDSDAGKLWVKGSGDPFLVSEEIELIATRIAELKPSRINEIILDSSLFDANLIVPGATTTNNPYDAVPSAIAANFNTIYLKMSGGSVISAEPQTPLTPYARRFENNITGSSLRINTGRNSRDSERYFAELLASLLRAKGVDVAKDISWDVFPVEEAELVHYNSKTLGEVIQAMLKYSTNFIANQLMLALVADRTGLPANFAAVRQVMEKDLQENFGWRGITFYEGAGLSVDNRVSAQQLLDLIIVFKQWRHLLDEVEPGVFAKTGTLTNVSSLAGFVRANGSLNPFVILINQPVPARFTRELAIEFSAK